jgi:hypothetical protein
MVLGINAQWAPPSQGAARVSILVLEERDEAPKKKTLELTDANNKSRLHGDEEPADADE